MATKAFVGIPVPFSSLIRPHLFVSVVRVTKTAFHGLILFETGAGQKRAVRGGKGKGWATTGRCDLMAGVDIPPANITQTEPLGAEDRTTSVAKGIAVEMELGPEGRFLPEMLGEELWRAASAEMVELSKAEFAEALETIGAKDNFGLDPGKQANERQREIFWRALHLEELAIARGCALGRESAWRRFLAQYREQLTRAAVEMTGSAALGEELASALYSELFGLTEREGKRWSPLLRYSGRGSLMGWLRAILAQRRVNQYRKTGRETELGEIEPAARVSERIELKQLEDLRVAIKMTLSAASAEERFVLSA